MRIARVCSARAYLPLFEQFFEQNGLASRSYAEALDTLRANGFLYPGGFSTAMQQRGYEVVEFVPDFPSLQRLWMCEHGWASTDTTTLALDQLRRAQPEAVYVQELAAISRKARLRLREDLPGLRAVVAFKGFPAMNCAEFSDLDLVFVAYPSFLAEWEGAGIPAHLLPHCYDPSVAPAILGDDVPEVIFVGSSGFGNVSHAPRYHGLARLLEETGIEIWGLELPGANWKTRVRPYLTWGLQRLPEIVLSRTAGDGGYVPRLFKSAQERRRGRSPRPWYVQERPLAQRFPGRVHPPVFGSVYAALIAAAKIVVNLHTDQPGEAGNMRSFEVTGAGTCLLTDRGDQMSHLFEPGVEIATFRTIDDCAEQIRSLLADDRRRDAIARRGQIRTLRDHTVHRRCDEIHAALYELLA